VYFSANNSTNGIELWKSNGTSSGTVLVKDIVAGVATSNPRSLTAAGTTLFFTANLASSGNELWKSNGTSSGTTLVRDILAGTGSSLTSQNIGVRYFTNVAGTIYFRAVDGATGTELWRSDGTSSGTVLLKDIMPGSLSSYP